MSTERKPSIRRGEMAFIFAIILGLVLGILIKKVRLGILLGLIIGGVDCCAWLAGVQPANNYMYMQTQDNDKAPLFKNWNYWYVLVIAFLGIADHSILTFHQTICMSQLDWIVLIVTLLAIIAYGLYKSRTSHNLDGYFLSNHSMPWGLVLLSIMGTQASAITFLSAPGQAYTDGMRFVQYYFGIPLAMVVICIFFVPIFSKLKVYTAYEYLETRFDGKTRTLTSFLFLVAKRIINRYQCICSFYHSFFFIGWNIYWTNLFMGGLLIIYTMTGGAKAVAYTQQLQLIIIFIGMFLAAYMVVNMLPENIGFTDALQVSGKLGKLNVITTGITEKGFNWSDQYNLLSGIIGGFLFGAFLFRRGPKPGGTISYCKICKRKPDGIADEWICKSADAIFDLADRGIGIYFLSI